MKLPEPLTIKSPEKGELAVVALWDIDGTVNDESRPESERLSTIGPAKQALEQLKKLGIPSGPITSRSSGEAQVYTKVLQTKGPYICEDGAVITPPGNPKNAIITSSIDREAIAKFIKFVEANFPNEEIVSTIFSTRERLMEACGHATLDDAEKSAQRHASAYVAPQNQEQRDFIFKNSPDWNLRAFGDIININGIDANKGRALQMLDKYASTFWGDNISGILPIIYGNNTNDIPSLEKAVEMGGIGVLVGKPGGGFSVSPEKIPSGVTLIDEPFGHGILKSVDIVIDTLKQRFHSVLR